MAGKRGKLDLEGWSCADQMTIEDALRPEADHPEADLPDGGCGCCGECPECVCHWDEVRAEPLELPS